MATYQGEEDDQRQVQACVDDWRSDTTDNDTDSDDEISEDARYLSGCSSGDTIVPECEVLLEGESELQLKLVNCLKNPTHSDFIAVSDFKAEHLPPDLRTDHAMDVIRKRIDLTVMIKVKYISPARPQTFYDSKAPYPYSQYRGSSRVRLFGTGTLLEVDRSKPKIGDCPCPECKTSDSPKQKYWMYRVITATHVIFDSSEAEKATIMCFHDSDESEEGVVILYGVKLKRKFGGNQLYQTDSCDQVKCVTHDESFAEKIQSRCSHGPEAIASSRPDVRVIVSHPHGCSKKVTIGNVLYMTFPITPNYEIGRPAILPEGTTYSCNEPERESLSTDSLQLETNRRQLPDGTTFTLLPGARYAMRYHYKERGYKFPPETQFHSQDGAVVAIPEDAVFHSDDSLFKDYQSYYSVSYDIPTCQGSSGALLVCGFLDWGSLQRFIPHSGVEDGVNRSGISLETTMSLYYYCPESGDDSLYKRFLKCMGWASCCSPWRKALPLSSTSSLSYSPSSTNSIPVLYY